MRFFLVVGALFLSPGLLAEPLSGVWDSPLGPMKLEETKGIVRARALAGGTCSALRGKIVFEGARIDDTITGTLKSCLKRTASCTGVVSGLALFSLTRDGRGLSGITHLTPAEGCAAEAEEAIRLVRQEETEAKPELTLARRTAEARAAEAVPHFEARRFARARALALDAFLLDPSWGQAANLVGATYAEEGKHDVAHEWYERALHLDPKNHDVYYNLAGTYAAQGKKALAVTYLKIAVVNGYKGEQFKTDADFRALRGFAAFEALKRGEL